MELFLPTTICSKMPADSNISWALSSLHKDYSFPSTLILSIEMHTLLPQLSGQITTVVLALCGLFVLFHIIQTLYNIMHFRVNSTIKDLPGPPPNHWFWGNLKEIQRHDAAVLHEKWVQEYGRTYKYKMLFGRQRLFTMDTKALNHILMNHYVYQKPEVARYQLSQILGEGVLVTEEDAHKLQRKIMNPAFGPAQIRELTQIFVDKSVELKDIWTNQIVNAETGVARIDVLSWLSRTALDVIGLAGFNYRFNALTDSSDELSQAFSVMFGNPNGDRIRMWALAQLLVPILRNLPTQEQPGFKAAKRTMTRIARQLLRESKLSMQGNGVEFEKLEDPGNGKERDLLSLLVRSNMSGGEHGQTMSDEDVLARESHSLSNHKTATTWALFALVQNPTIQHKLRQELSTLSTDNPSMDELNSLQYLDHVVRETLRLHAPVTASMRVAVKDDVIPLGESFVDRKGVRRDSIEVKKGQTIFVPILAINRDKSLWGEDALEFRPERWDNIPSAVSSIPGVWSNLLTFLGGGRACIGYRFSLVEMKSLLFTLVRTFEFEAAVPVEDVTARAVAVVQRPTLKSEKERGSQLPLLVRLYQPEKAA
ncbi:cytochrome P450 [Lentinula raphanica]|nr:cytochrome P450 [Lentinula raphanica]